MPVVINRSGPNGSSKRPDNSGAKPASPSPPKGGKPKKAASASIFEDQRVRIAALGGLIVIAILAALFSMGYFSGEPATKPTVAPAPTTKGASTTGADGGGSGAAGLRRPGPGMGPGGPNPDASGDDTASPRGGTAPGNGIQ